MTRASRAPCSTSGAGATWRCAISSRASRKAIAGFEPSLVVGATYPDTREEDIGAINGILAAEGRARMLALLLIDPADAARIDLKGYQLQAKVLVGHRYVPPAWQQTTLFLFARQGPKRSRRGAAQRYGARKRARGLVHRLRDARLGHGVAGVLHEREAAAGPRIGKCAGAFRRTEQIVAALHDRARNAREPLRAAREARRARGRTDA